MQPEWRQLIEQIHQAPQQCVIAVTGGGASAISDLLSVPGGSRTILEAVVPYSSSALEDWLGKRPEQFCAEETALAMASVAYRRATLLHTREAAANPPAGQAENVTQTGLACTAGLISHQVKRGDHRCFIAAHRADSTASFSLVLEKGARDRAGEEELVGHLLLHMAARAAGITSLPKLDLRPGECVIAHAIQAHRLLADLAAGRRGIVWSLPDGSLTETPPTRPAGVLCGAFNPLHAGHETLRAVAEKRLGGPVAFEICIANVDKPPLDFLTLERRRSQFTQHVVALTSAPTFAAKSAVLPDTAFVVGVDTADRIIEPRYYADGTDPTRTALQTLRDEGCRFLVAGRLMGDCFRTLKDVRVPPEFADLFEEIPPEEFRADISSTAIRRAAPPA